MKVGDLVIENNALRSARHDESPDIGIIIEDDVRFPGGNKRIGVMWTTGNGSIDYEIKEWIEVISEAK